MIDISARWISDSSIRDDAKEVGAFSCGSESISFRKTWNSKKGIEKAVLKLTSLGVYEVMLNGAGISNSKLSPGWSDYNSRIYYQTYDITGMIENQNEIVVTVGDGWYFGNVAHIGRGRYGREKKSIVGAIELTYTDGSNEVIPTDSSWDVVSSNVVYSDIIMGEKHDNTIKPVYIGPAKEQNYQKNLTSQKDQLITEREVVEHINIFQCEDGSEIYDFGQNLVGWVRYTISGKYGDELVFQYAEMMSQGDIYTENLRKAEQKDIVVLNGDQQEYFETKFTYHGFRYVKVTKPKTSKIIDAKAQVAHSGSEVTSSFHCSSPLVTKLFENIQWSQKGNFLSIPTDCPQRNERMGWLGDAQIFCKTALYNMDCKLFFEKYLCDIRDSQRSDGALPDVAPFIEAMSIDGFGGNEYLGLKYGSGGWADALIIISYQVYNHTGDKSVLVDNYEAMCLLINYYEKTSENFLRVNEVYGDWLSVGEISNKSFIASAFFYYSASLLSYISKVLGKSEEQNKFFALSENVRDAINRYYLTSDFLETMTQTENLLSIKFALRPENNEIFKNNLIESIIRNDYKISTGFIGVSYILPVLCDIGRADLAYRVLLNEGNPSWLYSVIQGATTIWERWDSYTHVDGISTESMNSFNHYSLGSVGQWIVEYMAGININNGDGKQSYIRPFFDTSYALTHCALSVKTADGKYKVEWKSKGDGVYTFSVVTPIPTKVCLADDEYLIDGEFNTEVNVNIR